MLWNIKYLSHPITTPLVNGTDLTKKTFPTIIFMYLFLAHIFPLSGDILAQCWWLVRGSWCGADCGGDNVSVDTSQTITTLSTHFNIASYRNIKYLERYFQTTEWASEQWALLCPQDSSGLSWTISFGCDLISNLDSIYCLYYFLLRKINFVPLVLECTFLARTFEVGAPISHQPALHHIIMLY